MMRVLQISLILLVVCLCDEILLSTVSKANATCLKHKTEQENNRIVLKDKSGDIISPGYPSYFSDSIQCIWLIHATEGHSIKLEFEFFDLGYSQSCTVEHDDSFVEVRDGIGSGSKPLGQFCGSSRPEKISSTANKMWVRFKANGYRSARFKATYTVVKGSPSVVLLIAGVSTIVGLMVILLLLTLYLKRKRRHCDEEILSVPGFQIQEKDPTPTCSTSRECIELNFSSVAGNASSPSLLEQEPSTSCGQNRERKCSQSLGTFALQNLAPVTE